MTTPTPSPEWGPPGVPPVEPDEAVAVPVGAVHEKVVERPSPLTGLAHSGIVLAGSVVLFLREIFEGGTERIGGFAIVALIIAAASALIAFLFGLAAWRTTTFIVDDEEFRVERRFLWSSSQRVDYTKVQSIEINQPLIARLLGLAKVQIDVGGAGGVGLSFLTLARAEALREHLLARTRLAKREVGAPDPSGPVTEADSGHAADAPSAPSTEPERLVHSVPIPTLFLGTLVSSPAFSFLTAGLVMLGLYLWQGTSITVFGILIAVAGWLWANIGGNWNFTVTERDGALRVRRGLASTSAQSLRPERIQAVSIRQDLLQRLTGLYRVRVTVLGNSALAAADENKTDSSVLLPFGTWEDAQKLLHLIWPEVDLNQIAQYPQPPRAKWLTPLSFSQHTWGIGPDVVVAHHGLIEHTLEIVPHVRMQSLSVSQGPLQRRLKLATLHVHTTSGPVDCSLYHLDEDLARTVFDDQLERGRQARALASS